MSKFTVAINTDNAAFNDDQEKEVARILFELTAKIRDEGLVSNQIIRLKDANGNRVGFAALEGE